MALHRTHAEFYVLSMTLSRVAYQPQGHIYCISDYTTMTKASLTSGEEGFWTS